LVLILGINSVHFIRKHLGRTGKIACPSFSLSLLFLPLGAVLCLLRLLGFQRNIHAFAYLLKLGNFGAGSFQFGVVGISLRFEVSVFLFPFGDRQRLCIRQICMEIAACCVP